MIFVIQVDGEVVGKTEVAEEDEPDHRDALDGSVTRYWTPGQGTAEVMVCCVHCSRPAGIIADHRPVRRTRGANRVTKRVGVRGRGHVGS